MYLTHKFIEETDGYPGERVGVGQSGEGHRRYRLPVLERTGCGNKRGSLESVVNGTLIAL